MGYPAVADPLASSYALLRVEPGAPLATATTAFRRLARELHPDVAGAATTERFVEVRAAYETIRRNATAGRAWRTARALDAYRPAAGRRSRVVDLVA